MSDTDMPLSLRNHLRGEVRNIVEEMRAGTLDGPSAIAALEAAANREEADLDAEDIEIDFEAGHSVKAGEIFAMLAVSGGGRSTTQGDPIDLALLDAIKIRDKISAEHIVGEKANDEDREKYKKSLTSLHAVLSKFIPTQD